MAEPRASRQEANPLVLFLAELSLALAEREREAGARRAKMRVVGAPKPGKEAAA